MPNSIKSLDMLRGVAILTWYPHNEHDYSFSMPSRANFSPVTYAHQQP